MKNSEYRRRKGGVAGIITTDIMFFLQNFTKSHVMVVSSRMCQFSVLHCLQNERYIKGIIKIIEWDLFHLKNMNEKPYNLIHVCQDDQKSCSLFKSYGQFLKVGYAKDTL